jgi:hypothetical protein
VEQEHSDRFFQALSAMGVMFSDELSKQRLLLYWETFREEVTIEEWEYTCVQAMRRETFHKVPLPAALMDYVREYRQMQARHEREVARQIAEAERLALEASPEWQAEQVERREAALRQRAEAEARQQEYQDWLAEQPREIRIALGQINPPDPSRWLPLTEDFSPEHRRPYEPHGGLQRRVNPEPQEEGA